MAEKGDRRGNRLSNGPPSRVFEGMTVLKQPADAVPFGESIGNGRWVWVAYAPDGELVAIAATSAEARAKYGKVMHNRK
jgi:hypothetical protein